MSNKEIVVSGIRPTGNLHIGNYFGAVRNYVAMQEDYECYFFIADWHSLTTHPDTAGLQKSVRRVAAENIACGLDPEKACFFLQSSIPEIAELYFYLNTLSYLGELEKTTTFKEKARQHPDNINTALLTYPVLQAADILIHKAAKVPVGKDQEQHLEMARNFAQRFNFRYKNIFPEPASFDINEKGLVKILSLDGEGKMSKSENNLNTIYLNDDDESIRKKIMRSKTDSGPKTKFSTKPDYIENLFTLMKLVSEQDVISKFDHDYQQSEEGSILIRYGDMKKQLAEDMIKFISPIREKAETLENDRSKLNELLEKGGAKARTNAIKTLEEVRNVVGLNYFK